MDVAPPYLSDLLLLHVVPLNHDFALEGATVPVVEDPLLCQEVRLLLGLGMLHVLLVLGQTLLFLLFGCAVVFVHLLKCEKSSQPWAECGIKYGVIGSVVPASYDLTCG